MYLCLSSHKKLHSKSQLAGNKWLLFGSCVLSNDVNEIN